MKTKWRKWKTKWRNWRKDINMSPLGFRRYLRTYQDCKKSNNITKVVTKWIFISVVVPAVNDNSVMWLQTFTAIDCVLPAFQCLWYMSAIIKLLHYEIVLQIIMLKKVHIVKKNKPYTYMYHQGIAVSNVKAMTTLSVFPLCLIFATEYPLALSLHICEDKVTLGHHPTSCHNWSLTWLTEKTSRI